MTRLVVSSFDVSDAASLEHSMPKHRARIDGGSDHETLNMLMALDKRTTSRADDEAVCISITMGLDLSSIM